MLLTCLNVDVIFLTQSENHFSIILIFVLIKRSERNLITERDRMQPSKLIGWLLKWSFTREIIMRHQIWLWKCVCHGMDFIVETEKRIHFFGFRKTFYLFNENDVRASVSLCFKDLRQTIICVRSSDIRVNESTPFAWSICGMFRCAGSNDTAAMFVPSYAIT